MCWHTRQQLEELLPDLAHVHCRLNEMVEVKSWVLGFGGAAKVIAPDELKDLAREEVQQFLEAQFITVRGEWEKNGL